MSDIQYFSFRLQIPSQIEFINDFPLYIFCLEFRAMPQQNATIKYLLVENYLVDLGIVQQQIKDAMRSLQQAILQCDND